jgi:hypothetical protein
MTSFQGCFRRRLRTSHDHRPQPNANNCLQPACVNLSHFKIFTSRILRALQAAASSHSHPPAIPRSSARRTVADPTDFKSRIKMANSAEEAKSYFPWNAVRSSSPKGPGPANAASGNAAPTESDGLKKVSDHAVSSTRGFSKRHYPPDCPPLVVQWYHAVDVS